VLHVDPAAMAQLGRMHLAGARFVARGCLMHELVRQITSNDTGPRSSGD